MPRVVVPALGAVLMRHHELGVGNDLVAGDAVRI